MCLSGRERDREREGGRGREKEREGEGEDEPKKFRIKLYIIYSLWIMFCLNRNTHQLIYSN